MVTIILRVGVLRDLQKEWLQRYFRYISKGTIASEAEILVIEVPLTCKCLDCGEAFTVDISQLRDETILCSSCHARQYDIVSEQNFRFRALK